jgi:hypothetical protein
MIHRAIVLSLSIAFLIGVFGAVFGSAATVTNTNDSGPGSLRQAIVDTPAGSTVNFALSNCPCTITLTTGEVAFAKSLTLAGPGADLLTISGNNSSRIFKVGQFQTILQASIVIEGLTIANGLAGSLDGGSGGAILIASHQTHLTVRNSVITRNNARPSMSGGGIYATSGGSVTIIGSTIRENVIPGFGGVGGGVWSSGNDVTIVNSLFSMNEVGFVGGGLFFSGGAGPEEEVLQIANTTFSGNVALGGGAFDIQNYATANVTGSTIEGNTSGYAVGNVLSATNITNCTFSGNTATAISNFATDGEDYPDAPSLLTITNSTIVGRVVTDRLCSSCDPAETTVRSSIIAGNGSDPNVGTEGSGKFISSGYNLIGNAGLVDAFVQPGDQAGTPGSPIDPRLEPLAINGGPTKTHALKLNSPALDKGKAFGSTEDQRGGSRPNDNPDATNPLGGDGSDIGSFEIQFPVSGTANLSGRVIYSGWTAKTRGSVRLSDSNNNVRWASLNPLGYYRFYDVPLGGSFTISLYNKGWTATSINIFTAESVSNLDLTASRNP